MSTRLCDGEVLNRIFDTGYVDFPSVLRICFFFGRGALQDVCREWPTSRFAAVYTLNPENPTPTPKDTARTVNKQCAACHSRISGSMSAHLAQVEDRSWKRVARIRIYKGTLTQGWPVPPRAQKKYLQKS